MYTVPKDYETPDKSKQPVKVSKEKEFKKLYNYEQYMPDDIQKGDAVVMSKIYGLHVIMCFRLIVDELYLNVQLIFIQFREVCVIHDSIIN